MKVTQKLDGKFAELSDSADIASEFLEHLLRKKLVTVELARDLSNQSGRHSAMSLRRLWEASDISAHDFADEVAYFFRLKRLTLPQLIGARPLIGRFTQRFLREAAIFPFDEGQDQLCLAVGDPSDIAAQKAAELVLGAPAEIAVA
jgi:general secretion pathway protein E